MGYVGQNQSNSHTQIQSKTIHDSVNMDSYFIIWIVPEYPLPAPTYSLLSLQLQDYFYVLPLIVERYKPWSNE